MTDDSPFRALIDPTERVASLDAFTRLRVSNPFSLFDSKQVYDDNPLFFVTDTATGGAVTYNQDTAASELTTNTTVGSRAIRQTRRYFNYQPGKSLLIL